MAGFLSRLFGGGGGDKTALDADPKLGRLVRALVEGCEYVLAAGDGAADMAVQLARRHSNCEVLACEPKSELCYQAENRAGTIKNVYLHNLAPGDFLTLVAEGKQYLQEKSVFVLLSAAGGGAERRFFDEVSMVASSFQEAWLLVLGCRVPERDEFAFHSQRGRECSLKNLSPGLEDVTHTLFVPAYGLPSSRRRAVPGWCLAALGRASAVPLPEEAVSLALKVS